MDINGPYTIKIEKIPHFLYEGICNDVPTKWITKTKWDYKIILQMRNNIMTYRDSDGDEILVFEEDEDEYKKYNRNNKQRVLSRREQKQQPETREGYCKCGRRNEDGLSYGGCINFPSCDFNSFF